MSATTGPFPPTGPEQTLPEAEADHLRRVYSQARVILEYGSGWSTGLAASMAGKIIVSVESDRHWAASMQAWLRRQDRASQPRVVHADIGPTGTWGRPRSARQWPKFYRYYNAIWGDPDFEHPDVVLIDGRFRPACFATVCLRITRPVRVVFDDYVPRPKYHLVEGFATPHRIVGRMAEFLLEPAPITPERLDLYLRCQTVVAYAEPQTRG